ncbi:MAG: hypothetical protein R3C45_14755 [Phycisphaerales bacterium]
MVGTGFFPDGKEQAYEVRETDRGGGYDLYLNGTGEVGLMGYHQARSSTPRSCRFAMTAGSRFRREAGAAGRHRRVVPRPPVRQGRTGRFAKPTNRPPATGTRR